MKAITRRNFIRSTTASAFGLGVLESLGQTAKPCCSSEPFQISLAQWSLHRALFEGRLDPLDFAKVAREDFDIGAIEYVNQFYMEKAGDRAYLAEMKKRAADHGVKSRLIMVDKEGNLGEPKEADRIQVVENHYKWVDAAAYLGCQSIRVNARGPGDRESLADAVADGLNRLAEYAAPAGLNVIVENHGGLSSDSLWLTGVIARVGRPNCGTLPDFGNFCIRKEKDDQGKSVCVEEYDRYKGVAEMMPYAKAVSAKSYNFDADGNETLIDYPRMMRIVTEAGYHDPVGIEYEGTRDDEMTGIRKTLDLLLRIRDSYPA